MDGVSDQAPMRDRAWIDAVRDRVLAEIAANPSRRPYLTLPRAPGRVLTDAEREARRERARSQQKRYVRRPADPAPRPASPGGWGGVP